MSDTVTYVLNEQEIFTALWHTRRSTTRLVVQTVLLLIIGLASLIALLRGIRDGATVLCGTVLPLLAILQWLWPFWEFRREARQLAEKKDGTHPRFQPRNPRGGKRNGRVAKSTIAPREGMLAVEGESPMDRHSAPCGGGCMVEQAV